MKTLTSIISLTLGSRPAAVRTWRPALTCLLSALVVCFLIVRGATAASEANFQIIVHPNVSSTLLEREFIQASFLKKTTRWDNGSVIFPVDLNTKSEIRAQFSDRVLKRSVAAVRNYWQQRIFSGRDVPPPEMDSDGAAMRYVAEHPGAIGYVSSTRELNGVKAVRIK